MSSNLDPGSGLGGSDGNGVTGSKPVVRQTGKSLTSVPEFYIDWAKENAKGIVTQINTVIGQLLTICVSLFAGAIAFWNYIPLDVRYRFLVVLALLLNVLVALRCSSPVYGQFDMSDPDDIRVYLEEIVILKRRRLLFLQVSVFSTLIAISIGLAWSVFEYSESRIVF